MTAADAPTAEQADERTLRWAAVLDRYMWDRQGPINAALRLQAEDDIRTAFAAVEQLHQQQHLLDQLRMRHKPVPVAEGERLICAATRKHPESCPDCRLLWGTEG